jgi:hypothetical protein
MPQPENPSVTSWREDSALASDATETLLSWHKHEARERRVTNARFSQISYVVGALVLYCVYSDYRAGLLGVEWLFSQGLIYGLVFGFTCTPLGVSHIFKMTATRLATRQEVRTVGVLLKAREAGDRDLREELEVALITLLPHLEETTLTLAERSSLSRALLSRNEAFLLAVIPAAARFGGSLALAPMRRLAAMPDSTPERAEVARMAQKYLPVLRERLERGCEVETLLRPHATREPHELLLRPLRGATEPVCELPRPVYPPQKEEEIPIRVEGTG